MSEEALLRRILIAYDAMPRSMAALTAALDLAATLNAELVGVFVEDAALLRQFALPFIRARAQYTARQNTYGLQEITHEMHARSAEAEEVVAAEAVRRRLRWSFRTVHGEVPQALLTAAVGTDLVVLGRASRASGRGPRALGTTVAAVTRTAAVSTMVVASGQRLRPPIALLDDGSPATVLAARLAALLADQLRGPLHTLELQSEGNPRGTTRPGPGGPRGTGSLHHHSMSLMGASFYRLVATLTQLQPGLLVAPRAIAWSDGDLLGAVFDELPCPVLLVR